jgi:hypothetical protein
VTRVRLKGEAVAALGSFLRGRAESARLHIVEIHAETSVRALTTSYCLLEVNIRVTVEVGFRIAVFNIKERKLSRHILFGISYRLQKCRMVFMEHSIERLSLVASSSLRENTKGADRV